MKIVNNTNKVITLISGKRIPKYGSIEIADVTEELVQQLNNLERAGLIRVFR